MTSSPDGLPENQPDYQTRMNKLMDTVKDVVLKGGDAFDELIADIIRVKNIASGNSINLTFKTHIMTDLAAADVDTKTISRLSSAVQGMRPIDGLAEKLREETRKREGEPARQSSPI